MWIQDIINDTLKKYDSIENKLKWSRTSLTMSTAWFACMFTYMADYFMHGFRTEAFMIMIAVALGSKLSDALSNKLNK